MTPSPGAAGVQARETIHPVRIVTPTITAYANTANVTLPVTVSP